MSNACRTLFEDLAAESPALKGAFQDAKKYWAPDEPPVTSLLATFANCLVNASADPMVPGTERALRIVEAAMVSGDVDLVTAVSTGFIEGLVASADRHGVLTQFLAALGPVSRSHADRWLSFEG
jgi:hypothetical protein